MCPLQGVQPPTLSGHSLPEDAHHPPHPPTALARREEESLSVPTKRRRVTAEMEGKYIINMPKGTTPRTRKILEQQQAAKGTGLGRGGGCVSLLLCLAGLVTCYRCWPRSRL